MRYGLLSAELSPDPGQACELALLYGIRYLELRNWHQFRAPEGMTEADMVAPRPGLSYCGRESR